MLARHFKAISVYFITAFFALTFMMISCNNPKPDETDQTKEVTVEEEITTTNPVRDTSEQTAEILGSNITAEIENPVNEVEGGKPGIIKTTTQKVTTTKTVSGEVKIDTITATTEVKETKKPVEENNNTVTTKKVTSKVTKVVTSEKKESPNDGWNVPAKYMNMKNPYASGKPDMATAKIIYSKHCKACHGKSGDGDGPKSANLDTKIPSFKSTGFKAQKPGAVYYKAIFGRDEMPNFEKKIPDEEDRWNLVVYIMGL